jgi:putative DNA methylase
VVGRVDNLRPIGNRPAEFHENVRRDAHFFSVIESLRRHLPHRYAVGKPIFLTWRLHGTLPVGRSFPEKLTSGQAFVAMDQLLDHATVGHRFLSRPEIASIVTEAILSRDGGPYTLHAWVAMPNHVHLLITPLTEVSKVMQSLKRFTARECNKVIGRIGQPFWQDESYDRLVRDTSEFARIARYIEMNPVKAGLVTAPEKFLWSSGRPITNRPQVRPLAQPHGWPYPGQGCSFRLRTGSNLPHMDLGG